MRHRMCGVWLPMLALSTSLSAWSASSPAIPFCFPFIAEALLASCALISVLIRPLQVVLYLLQQHKRLQVVLLGGAGLYRACLLSMPAASFQQRRQSVPLISPRGTDFVTWQHRHRVASVGLVAAILRRRRWLELPRETRFIYPLAVIIEQASV